MLDLTYYWLVKDATEDDVEKLKAQLWLPPKRSSKPLPKSSPWSDESTLASVAALAGAQEVGS